MQGQAPMPAPVVGRVSVGAKHASPVRRLPDGAGQMTQPGNADRVRGQACLTPTNRGACPCVGSVSVGRVRDIVAGAQRCAPTAGRAASPAEMHGTRYPFVRPTARPRPNGFISRISMSIVK